MIVLLNAAAKNGRGSRARVAALLSERAIACEIVEESDPRRLTTLALRARQKGHQTVVAGGGDGTLNAVASALVGTDIAFGILPLGTRNHFARDVGIPLDVASAIDVIVSGNSRRIDVGSVNGRTFLNNSALGLYPYLAELRDKQRRILGTNKRIAMRRAMISTYKRLPSLRVRIDSPNGRIAAITRSVFVGNNEYTITGAGIGKRSTLDGGALCIYVTPRVSRGRLALTGFKALLGRPPNDEEMRQLKAREVFIHTNRHHPRVALDGEVCRLRAPLHYRILPASLRVLCP
jgi:YegS/Rv2252/BmrU family lipid kinase